MVKGLLLMAFVTPNTHRMMVMWQYPVQTSQHIYSVRTQLIKREHLHRTDCNLCHTTNREVSTLVSLWNWLNCCAGVKACSRTVLSGVKRDTS